MEFKSEYYNETQIESFIISYGFKEGKISNKNIIKSNINLQLYKNNKLVISFNPLDFGNVLNITKLDDGTLYILQSKDNLITKILNSGDQNSIEIFNRGDLIIKFNDFKLTENKFVRVIDNNKFYFENNQQILFSKEIKTKFISKLANIQEKIKDCLILFSIGTLIISSLFIFFFYLVYFFVIFATWKRR
jgi:hypothetical protein